MDAKRLEGLRADVYSGDPEAVLSSAKVLLWYAEERILQAGITSIGPLVILDDAFRKSLDKE